MDTFIELIPGVHVRASQILSLGQMSDGSIVYETKNHGMQNVTPNYPENAAQKVKDQMQDQAYARILEDLRKVNLSDDTNSYILGLAEAAINGLCQRMTVNSWTKENAMGAGKMAARIVTSTVTRLAKECEIDDQEA